MGQDYRSRGHIQYLPSIGVGHGVSPLDIRTGSDVAGVLASHSFHFIHSGRSFKSTNQAGSGNSTDKTVQPVVTPDLFILRRLGLRLPAFRQSAHFGAAILKRCRAAVEQFHHWLADRRK